jgi:hypothetical protein
MMNKLNFVRNIVVHHSAELDGAPLDYPVVLQDHTRPAEQGGKGFDDLGYHTFIELYKPGPDPGSWIAIHGRSEIYQGAHALGANHYTLGICFGGNFNLFKPDPNQLRMGAKVVAPWIRQYKLDITAIIPHLQLNATECPGKYFPLDTFRKMVKELLS